VKSVISNNFYHRPSYSNNPWPIIYCKKQMLQKDHLCSIIPNKLLIPTEGAISQLNEKTHSIGYSSQMKLRFWNKRWQIDNKNIEKKKILHNSEPNIYLNFTISFLIQRRKARSEEYTQLVYTPSIDIEDFEYNVLLTYTGKKLI